MMSSNHVPQWLDVSRETIEGLDSFLALVRKWNTTINLVSEASLRDGWTRHILDSAQLWRFRGEASHIWVDIGSGGGFPGLVLAILAKGEGSEVGFRLVESDARKATFLREAVRQLDLAAEVVCGRVERVEKQYATSLSARAFAPLESLLGYCWRHLDPSGTAILPKGRNFREEVQVAQKRWCFELEEANSLTDPDSKILLVRNIQHV